MHLCLSCKQPLVSHSSKYCSNTCQRDYQHEIYIQEWKAGNRSGNRGINTYNISQHISRYLFKKFDSQCAICGWREINPVTKVVPLEIDHIDGDANNNTETNLRLLCPNCHSLTPNYRNLNKGKGRVWRRDKYAKIL